MDYEETLAKVAGIFETARDTLLTAKPIAQELEDESDDESVVTDAKGIIEYVDDIARDLDEAIAAFKDDSDVDDDEDDEAEAEDGEDG